MSKTSFRKVLDFVTLDCCTGQQICTYLHSIMINYKLLQSILKFLYLRGDIIIAGEMLQNLGLGPRRREDLYCVTQAVTQDFGFPISFKGPPHLGKFYKQPGQTQILWTNIYNDFKLFFLYATVTHSRISNRVHTVSIPYRPCFTRIDPHRNPCQFLRIPRLRSGEKT
jgi:hypothetical protein